MRRSNPKRWMVCAAVALFPFAGAATFAHQEHHHDHGQGAPAQTEAAVPSQQIDPAHQQHVHPQQHMPPQQDAAAPEPTHWGADYFPNVTLTTHEGKTVRFFDDLIKNKVVAINFMYASCKESCPLETAQLLHVQRILGDRVGREVFFYSITIDPKNDTPEVLKAYMEKFKVGPGWTFLTGNVDDITLLRKKLGLYQEAVEEDRNDHTLSLITGNQATGQWGKRSAFDNPYLLAEQLGGWLQSYKYGTVAAQKNFSEAPLRLRKLTAGETLFRDRCIACHTIGGGDMRDVARGNLGPDLLNVTQERDRGWLARWIANPEKMLVDKDPLALELYARYNRLTMPNLQLNERNVAAVIEYLEAESHRIKEERQKAASVSTNTP